MKGWLTVVAVVFCVLAGPAMAFSGAEPGTDGFALQSRVFRTIDLYWQSRDQLENPEEAKLERITSELGEQEETLGKIICTAVEQNDHQTLDLLRSLYGSLDDASRQALFPALQNVRAKLVSESRAGDALRKLNEYFPGYGYPELGYKYRRGLELEREYKGTSTQFEEHTLSTSKAFNLTVTLDVLGILKGLFSGGLIKNFMFKGYQSIVPGYGSPYGSQPMIVANVSFTTSETMFTRCERKYEVYKVWFELLRSNNAGWTNSGTWEKCGKTYEILQDPTGQIVVTEVKPASGTSVPEIPPAF